MRPRYKRLLIAAAICAAIVIALFSLGVWMLSSLVVGPGPPPQGVNEYANSQNTFAARWRYDDNPEGLVALHVLEVVELPSRRVVFTDQGHFRARDFNWAAWSTTPNVLLAYSGDIGTLTFGLTGGSWRDLGWDATQCVDLITLPEAVRRRFESRACD